MVQILEKLNKILELMHLYYQSGFFVGFIEFFHLRIELNNFFSFDVFLVLQNALVKISPCTLLLQILE